MSPLIPFTATLDHIGIATADAAGKPSPLSKLFQILGIQKGITESVPEQGVNVHFFSTAGAPPHLELLEVSNPQGAVAKFIEKKGPGIHHLSFLISNGALDSLCERLKSEGFKLTYETPKIGAQQMRINFIHPATAGGVLIELMEKAV